MVQLNRSSQELYADVMHAQVNIYCDCPLWPDDSMCSNRACSVCECGENEVPVPWLAAEQATKATCKATQNPDCDTEGCKSFASALYSLTTDCDVVVHTALCVSQLAFREVGVACV